ncbi:hypothetical protein ACQEVF_27395 [Nonomuraea polychroma]|uniref:hypothetical protein n=1 Tax=Nonomuraea polychroma TaxID=46176 RepID=UPI003D91370B
MPQQGQCRGWLATANVTSTRHDLRQPRFRGTGNLALREDDFARIPNGAYLASVISSDDELELPALAGLYTRTPVEEHITRYACTGHYFYLLANGNAVNFLHGASVGTFILLVQAATQPALGSAQAARYLRTFPPPTRVPAPPAHYWPPAGHTPAPFSLESPISTAPPICQAAALGQLRSDGSPPPTVLNAPCRSAYELIQRISGA